jgi:hypothetical protein
MSNQASALHSTVFTVGDNEQAERKGPPSKRGKPTMQVHMRQGKSGSQATGMQAKAGREWSTVQRRNPPS